MDQPPQKSALEKLENLLGLEWVVKPFPSITRGSNANAKNRVIVIENPGGASYTVTRWYSSVRYPFFQYRCGCLDGKQGDNRCAHILKAIEFWGKTRG